MTLTNDVELLTEFFLHLRTPLRDKTSRTYHKDAAHKPARLKFFYYKSRLNCLTKSDFISKDIADVVVRQCPVQNVQLVGRRDDAV